MGKAFLLSISAAFNPTLFAALMVMLVSRNAQRLMLGFLIGAYVTSVTAGLVIVFVLPNSGAVSTSRNTLSPALDLALGSLAIIAGLVLSGGSHDRVRDWRRRRGEKKAEKGPPRWRRALDEGSPRVAFVVGMALSLPGASYLIALDILHKQDLPAAPTALCVLAFVLIEMVLLEVPVLGFAVDHDRTVAAVDRFRSWVTRDARTIASRAAFIIGVLLIVRGVLELL